MCMSPSGPSRHSIPVWRSPQDLEIGSNSSVFASPDLSGRGSLRGGLTLLRFARNRNRGTNKRRQESPDSGSSVLVLRLPIH